MPPRGRAGAVAGSSGPARPHPLLVRLRAVLPQLHAAADHLLQLPGGEEGPDESTWVTLRGVVLGVCRHGSEATTSPLHHQILADPPLLAALMKLAAAGARLSVLATYNTWHVQVVQVRTWAVVSSLWAVANTCCPPLPEPLLLQQLELLSRLLRMGVLHGVAAQIAEAAQLLRSGRPLLDRGIFLLSLVQTCTRLLGACTAPFVQAGGGGQGPSPRLAALAQQLTDALTSSRVLDHAVYYVLHLATHPDVDAGMKALLRPLLLPLLRCSTAVASTCSWPEDRPLSRQAGADLAHALCPAGVVLLLVMRGLCALQRADGGPADGSVRPEYGLDLAAYHAVLPVETLVDCVVVMVTAFEFGGVMPWGVGPSCSVLLRTADYATRVLRVRAQGGGAAAAHGSAAGPAFRLTRKQAEMVLSRCLQVAVSWLGGDGRLPAARRGAWVRAWRCALAYLDCLLEEDDGEALKDELNGGAVSAFWASITSAETGPEPLVGPSVSARGALAAGVLPFVERVLRRTGEACRGAHAELSAYLVPTLLPLLVHGPPQQVAALAVTAGKVLRRLQQRPWPAAAARRSTAASLLSPQGLLEVACGELLLDLCERGGAGADAAGAANGVVAAGGAAAVAGAGGAEGVDAGAGAQSVQAAVAPPLGGPDPWPQLTRVVCEVLPPVAQRLVRVGLGMVSEPRFVEVPPKMGRAMKAVTRLASALLAKCLLGVAGPAPAAASGAGPGPGSGEAWGAGCAAEWRQLLLERVGVVQLAGALLSVSVFCLQNGVGMQLAPAVVGTLEMCHGAAAAFPEQLLAALRPPAAGAGGAASSSSRAPSNTGSKGRRGAGAGGSGGAGGAGGSSTDGCSLQAWPLGELAGLVEQGKVEGRAAELVQQLVAWADSGGQGPGLGSTLTTSALAAGLHRIAARLVPVAAARSLLRCCSNPACVVLAGDSEAGLALQACGGCGGAWYCCAGCREAHARAGHAEACAGGAGGSSSS